MALRAFGTGMNDDIQCRKDYRYGRYFVFIDVLANTLTIMKKRPRSRFTIFNAEMKV
jgi:hypothetical protein